MPAFWSGLAILATLQIVHASTLDFTFTVSVTLLPPFGATEPTDHVTVEPLTEQPPVHDTNSVPSVPS